MKELKHSNLNANIVARMIADKIENRQSFKRAAKSAIEQVMKAGAIGIKISCAGRLNGAEIARTENKTIQRKTGYRHHSRQGFCRDVR